MKLNYQENLNSGQYNCRVVDTLSEINSLSQKEDQEEYRNLTLPFRLMPDILTNPSLASRT